MSAEPAFHAVVLTLFPDLYPGPLGASLLGRALKDGVWRLDTLDFRAYARDKHRSVDDTPAGGGPGLVLRADIAAAAIDAAVDALGDRAGAARRICLSPRGRPMSQALAQEIAASGGAILLCGRFEGIDQRALDARGMEEVCVGDAVLTGGDIPAMAVLDATVRLLPGVLGAAASLEDESFAQGLLEHPHYTRPAVWEDRAIPDVLLSGDHGKVAAWRRRMAEEITQARRPDLWRTHQEKLATSTVDAVGSRMTR